MSFNFSQNTVYKGLTFAEILKTIIPENRSRK